MFGRQIECAVLNGVVVMLVNQNHTVLPPPSSLFLPLTPLS